MTSAIRHYRLVSYVLIILILSVDRCFASSEEPSIPQLKKKQGYLLINVDVGGVAPSIDYRAVFPRGSYRTREGRISLKNMEKGLYLIALRKGDYQVSAINVPHYDLPYLLDTSPKKSWQFSVEENKVNYFGRLEIAKARNLESVYVSRKNRIASDYGLILSEFGELIKRYPLTTNSGYRDDFLPFYINTSFVPESN